MDASVLLPSKLDSSLLDETEDSELVDFILFDTVPEVLAAGAVDAGVVFVSGVVTLLPVFASKSLLDTGLLA